MMLAVLDVSAVTQILLHNAKMDKFNAVLQEAALVLAPDSYISELTNTFWKYRTAKMFTEEECLRHIHDGLEYVDYFVNSNELWQEALHEGIANNHSVYDMLYLVIARRNNGILISNDGPLVKICDKLKIQYCY
jgi:predicted nucleic acid-binding protein